MSEEELQYSPQQFDFLEGRAQDIITHGNPFDECESVRTVMAGEALGGTPLSEPFLRFLKSVSPSMVIKMVIIVRRLRYLLECSQQEVLLLKAELEKRQSGESEEVEKSS